MDAVFDGYDPGLGAAAGVQVLDSLGGVVTARTHDGIVESPAESGIYLVRVVAPDESGVYNIAFDDGSGDYAAEILTVSVGGDSNYTPTVDSVGALIRSRTIDSTSNELGSFTPATRPTNTQVESLIATAEQEVALSIGEMVPDSLVGQAAGVVALRAAMFVELTYFPEQVAANRSSYAQLKDLYDDLLPKLIKKVADIEAEEGDSDSTDDSSGLARFDFPASAPRLPLRW